MTQTNTAMRQSASNAELNDRRQASFFFYPTRMGFKYSTAIRLILLLVVLLHTGALLVKVLAVSDGDSVPALDAFSFSLDAGLPFYGLICVIAISSQFQHGSIAISMTRRPNRNRLFLREMLSAPLLVLAASAILSVIFFCSTLVLSFSVSTVTLEEGFYGAAAQNFCLFCLAVLALSLASSALSFVFRSTAGSVIAYAFFLWLLPVAGASLAFTTPELGELLVRLSPGSILADLMEEKLAFLPAAAGLAWIVVALIAARLRFERYTP